MRHRRLLFVLKERDNPYGWGGGPSVSSGLFNSASFVAEMLTEAGVPSKVVQVKDGNDIDREIVAFAATDVMIEAFWCPAYKFDDLAKARPRVRFTVRNHSKSPFLAQESSAFGKVFEYLEKPNVCVSPNSVAMLDELRFLVGARHPEWGDGEVDDRVPYLPNFYPLPPEAPDPKQPNGVLDVGCFGAVRPLKNQVTQAIAALMFADRFDQPLRFHINGGRVEMDGSPVLRSLRDIFDGQPGAELVLHDWLPHDEFLQLVASMDVVTQVSFSETFCIVAADAAAQGVPLVTSPEIPWGAVRFQADPTDARQIAHRMAEAFEWGGYPLHNPNRLSLKDYVWRAKQAWLAFLD